jgi:hypothetical protein
MSIIVRPLRRARAGAFFFYLFLCHHRRSLVAVRRRLKVDLRWCPAPPPRPAAAYEAAADRWRRRAGAPLRAAYVVEEYLVTALVPSDTACLASSPGSSRRTAVCTSRLVSVAFLA